MVASDLKKYGGCLSQKKKSTSLYKFAHPKMQTLWKQTGGISWLDSAPPLYLKDQVEKDLYITCKWREIETICHAVLKPTASTKRKQMKPLINGFVSL